jgi:transcriptional regulator with XRE-family HTH domain
MFAPLGWTKGCHRRLWLIFASLHRTYVGSIERMERNASLATLELLAGALGVGVPELLTPREYAKKKVAT